MGKRTLQVTGKTHEKRARDLWPTIDPKARKSLVPHLPRGVTYAEPMAGDGALVRLLGPEIVCAWASDIEPGAPWIERRDVFDVEIGEAQLFITNPPWTRGLLHRIIPYLSDQAPTWLLFDADWAQTDQAGRFMTRCRRIVATGRLIWIAGTTNGGLSACAWYLFDKPLKGSAPVFYGHGQLPRSAYRPEPPAPSAPGSLLEWSAS